MAEDEIVIESTTASEAELAHAVSEDWRKTPAEIPAEAVPAVAEKTEGPVAGAPGAPAAPAKAVAAGTSAEDEDVHGTVSKRIGKLRGRIQERDTTIDRLTAELEEARKPKNGAAGAATSVVATPAVVPASAKEPTLELDPATGKPYDDYAKYTRDLVNYHTEKTKRDVLESLKAERQTETQARAQVEANARHEKTLETYNSRLAEFRTTHADFDDVVDDLGETKPISATLQLAVLRVPNGPAVAYHLAKNLEEYKRISALEDIDQAMEIGKLSAALLGKGPAGQAKAGEAAASKAAEDAAKAAAAAPATAAAVPSVVSSAPAPIEPVRAGGAVTGRLPLDHPDVSYEEYCRRRAAGET